MPPATTLLSFVGNRDPYVENSEDFGPVLSLLQARAFDRAVLFCTGPDYLERAKAVEEASHTFDCRARFRFVGLELDSPIDYEEILSKLGRALEELAPELSLERVSVLLDPGTPQMQTAWFLLAKSGVLQAHLLQGIPPRFAGGAYKVREVNLDSRLLPEVRMRGREGPALMHASEATTLDEEAALFSLARETAALEDKEEDEGIVGQSPGFLKALDQARRVAAYNITVLLLGETGTGKGLLARRIHDQSARAAFPFVSVNCAAIGPALAESELFGHVKGAFTGADHNRPGRLRSAEGGTVLLDEIGDLPPDIQPKLLRALEDKIIVPVGADAEIKVNVRILAATNQDLEKLIAAGRFRRDLYERLAQFSLQLPPLRERREDIPLLLRRFLQDWNERYGENKQISEEALRYLLDYPWPGNVRELANAVVSLCAMSLHGPIPADLLPAQVLAHFRRERGTPDLPLSLPEGGLDLRALLFQTERHFYQEALRRARGNREKAAGLLGLNGPAFRKALRERFPELTGEAVEE